MTSLLCSKTMNNNNDNNNNNNNDDNNNNNNNIRITQAQRRKSPISGDERDEMIGLTRPITFER